MRPSKHFKSCRTGMETQCLFLCGGRSQHLSEGVVYNLGEGAVPSVMSQRINSRTECLQKGGHLSRQTGMHTHACTHSHACAKPAGGGDVLQFISNNKRLLWEIKSLMMKVRAAAETFIPSSQRRRWKKTSRQQTSNLCSVWKIKPPTSNIVFQPPPPG